MVLAYTCQAFKQEKEKKMRTAIIDALEARYEAQILEADATLKLYLENSVGIGEHPQHLEEVDKLIENVDHSQVIDYL